MSFIGYAEEKGTHGKSETHQEKDPAWIPIWEKEDFRLFYDKSTLRRSSSGVVKVWIKSFESPDKVIQNKKASRQKFAGYDEYSYTLAFFQFDCAQKTFQELDYSDYNRHNKIMAYGMGPDKKFPVKTGTVGEKLFKEFCR
jgi:Surface-adhesin protein E